MRIDLLAKDERVVGPVGLRCRRREVVAFRDADCPPTERPAGMRGIRFGESLAWQSALGAAGFAVSQARNQRVEDEYSDGNRL